MVEGGGGGGGGRVLCWARPVTSCSCAWPFWPVELRGGGGGTIENGRAAQWIM